MSIFEYDQETHIKQEREESLAIGEERGYFKTLIRQTIKKLAKGLNEEDIIGVLEENPDVIHIICVVASKYAPDYDVDQICAELLQEK